MFGFGKKQKEMMDDPKKAIEHADKTINSGVTGFLTKSFMGKDFMDKANAGLDMAKNAMDSNNLSTTGVPASAEVLSIEDTGMLVNYNPVVKMKLKVTPQFGMGFESTVQTTVSKIAIPRVGDTINIKYNAANTSEAIVV